MKTFHRVLVHPTHTDTLIFKGKNLLYPVCEVPEILTLSTFASEAQLKKLDMKAKTKMRTILKEMGKQMRTILHKKDK